MAVWVYLAGKAAADVETTIELAISYRVIVRSARNRIGNLIGNVGKICPGDGILICYRGDPIRAVCFGTVASPLGEPATGTRIIEELGPPLARTIAAQGYTLLDNEMLQVIRLVDVEECEFNLAGVYGGQGSIHPIVAGDLQVLNRR